MPWNQTVGTGIAERMDVMCSASPDDLETRIRQAVDDVLVQARETFLDIDEDEFTALSYVTTHAVMAEVNRKVPTAP